MAFIRIDAWIAHQHTLQLEVIVVDYVRIVVLLDDRFGHVGKEYSCVSMTG